MRSLSCRVRWRGGALLGIDVQLRMLVARVPVEALPGGDLPGHDLEGPARLDIDRAAVLLGSLAEVARSRVPVADLVPDRRFTIVKVRAHGRLHHNRRAFTENLPDRWLRLVHDEADARGSCHVMGPP